MFSGVISDVSNSSFILQEAKHICKNKKTPYLVFRRNLSTSLIVLDSWFNLWKQLLKKECFHAEREISKYRPLKCWKTKSHSCQQLRQFNHEMSTYVQVYTVKQSLVAINTQTGQVCCFHNTMRKNILTSNNCVVKLTPPLQNQTTMIQTRVCFKSIQRTGVFHQECLLDLISHSCWACLGLPLAGLQSVLHSRNSHLYILLFKGHCSLHN